ncbi:MAG: 6-hydroxymethylpterin diphosphokinase MptE-like protein [Parachlamydiales bacterium]|jgi:hypothetical protein
MSSGLFERNREIWKSLLPSADKYIPKLEASSPLTEYSSAEIQNMNSSLQASHHQCFLIYGIGEGALYKLLRPWLESNPSRTVIFVEDSPHSLGSFLNTELATQFLHDKQVFLLFGNTEDEMGHFIHLISLSNSKYNFHFAAMPKKNQAMASSLQALARFIWLRSQEHAREYKAASKAFTNNFYHNLYLLPESKDYSNFLNAFKGVPAIIAGAGPSLSRNRHLLNGVKDNALLIGGGTSINALNSGNVQPHLGVGIDPNPSFYNRILSSTAWEVPFIYYYRMYHQAISLVHGEKIFMNFAPGITIPYWFHEQLGIHFASTTDKEMLNVINVATFIALQLGCNPIIFVGIDLAYTSDSSYAKGLQSVASQVSATSFTTKTEDEEIIVRKDIYGQPIKTLWKWTLESLWYSKLKADYPDTTFINCTEGGLGFHGIPNQSLQETLSAYCKENFAPDEKLQSLLKNTKRCTNATTQELSNLLLQFDASLENCQKALEGALTLNKNDGAWEKLPLSCGQEISEEPAYRHLIQTFDDYLQLQLQLPFLRLETLRAEIGESVYFKEKIALQENRLKQILDAIHSNRKMISNAIASPHLPPLNIPQDGYEKKIFDGTVLRTYYPDGTPKSIIPYLNGFFDGEILLYYHDGSLSRKLHYQKGKKHGNEEVWNRGGQLVLQAEYREDTPIGIAREWHFNGVLARECRYNENGEVLSAQNWDKNGKSITKNSNQQKDYKQQLLSQVILLENALKGILIQLRHIPAYQQEFGTHTQAFLQRTLKLRNTLTASAETSKDTGESLENTSAKSQAIENEIHLISQAISAVITKMQQQLSK